MTPEEYMNSIVMSKEFTEINEMLIEAAKKIKKQYYDLDRITRLELYEDKHQEAWIKAFKHHLQGCDGK